MTASSVGIAILRVCVFIRPRTAYIPSFLTALISLPRSLILRLGNFGARTQIVEAGVDGIARSMNAGGLYPRRPTNEWLEVVEAGAYPHHHLYLVKVN